MSPPRKPNFKKKALQRTFIREWRQYRGYTLEQLAEMIGTTHATLSRIERGQRPYNQVLLEILAEALLTDPASLLIRNPQEPTAIWTIWDQAQPGEREQIVDLAKVVVRRTGTGG